MELGMVGSGQMGANFVRRVSADGHRCVAFDVDPDAVKGFVKDGVPARILATALFSRFGSRDFDQFANQVLSAMRKGFGGHGGREAE